MSIWNQTLDSKSWAERQCLITLEKHQHEIKNNEWGRGYAQMGKVLSGTVHQEHCPKLSVRYTANITDQEVFLLPTMHCLLRYTGLKTDHATSGRQLKLKRLSNSMRVAIRRVSHSQRTKFYSSLTPF